MSESETDVEETVMLTRRDRRRAGAASQPSEADPQSAESSAEDLPETDDATIVVDRSRPRDAGTADEETVVVARPARRIRRRDEAASTPPASSPAESDPDARPAPDAQPAPDADPSPDADADASPFAAPAEPAPAIYKPRPAPLVPGAPPVVVGAAAPSRVDDPDKPSVARQSRRWSMLSLGAFAAACVVSVAGLAGVVVLVLS